MKDKYSRIRCLITRCCLRLVVTTLVALIITASVDACPACEQANPRILRGLVHGSAPQGSWEFALVLLAMVVAGLVGIYSIKLLFCPGETAADHIKYHGLDIEAYER